RTVKMMGGNLLENDKTGLFSAGPAVSAAQVQMPHGMADAPQLIAYHAYAATNWLSMHCRRHMELYGTTKEQLGWLAVNTRHNAARNP
ncbi:hypothetical protein, partial [Escherichia coli]